MFTRIYLPAKYSQAMSAAPPAGVVLTPDEIAAERAARAAARAAAAPARARDAARRADAKNRREVKELVNTGGQEARSGTHSMQWENGMWYTRAQMARITRLNKSIAQYKKEQAEETVRELRARDRPVVHAGVAENPHVGVNLGQGRKKGKSRPTMVGGGPIMRTAEYRPRMWPRLGLPDPIGMGRQSGGAKRGSAGPHTARTLDGMPIHVPPSLQW